jgi:hypothetical protein
VHAHAQTSLPADAVSPDGVIPPIAPSLGALDKVYDRTKWDWITNLDGRSLLKHRQVAQCYLNPQPPGDFHDAGFRLKREEKTIGKSRYKVVHAYEGKQFWEAIYIPPQAELPILGVYAAGPCQREAELILENYDRYQRMYVDSGT